MDLGRWSSPEAMLGEHPGDGLRQLRFHLWRDDGDLGANANDIWAVSEQGGFWHWDGTKWAKVEPTGGAGQRPHGVWGFSATDVWAVGSDDAPQHWDESAWTAASSSQGGFSAIWGSASNDVWAAGDHGALSHYDGKTWKDRARDAGPRKEAPLSTLLASRGSW